MAVANPTAAGESNEVDLSDKLATREVASMKNTSHLEDVDDHAAEKVFLVAEVLIDQADADRASSATDCMDMA